MSEQKRGILPRKIKGFRDINPDLNQIKQTIITNASKVYQSYGFEHWDTPVLEFADALGKYMPDKEAVGEGVFSFKSPEVEPVYNTKGQELRDDYNQVLMERHHLAMRYDLTAPLARMYAERLWIDHLKNRIQAGKSPLFRRYQYGPVFRYEIKLAPGRFREFWQLDFDSVGTDDIASDAEVPMILSDALEAIGLKRGTYRVKVNNRKLLKGVLQGLGVDTEEQEQAILRVIDKYDKIGIKAVKMELGEGRKEASGSKIMGLKLEKSLIDGVGQFFETFEKVGSRKEVLDSLSNAALNSELAEEGLEELGKIDTILSNLGFDEERVVFDPTLVRGMGYYTGPIFEVESLQNYIDDKGIERRVGSICGGGRYDGLVQSLLGMKVPATGASIGVDRLAKLLELTKQMPEKARGPVFIPFFDSSLMGEYQKMARELRQAGIPVEVYYGSVRGLKRQMKYADAKNAPIALMMGSNEVEKGIVSVKNLALGKKLAATITDKKIFREKTQFEVNRADLIARLKQELEG